jgi:hypothetical protein
MESKKTFVFNNIREIKCTLCSNTVKTKSRTTKYCLECKEKVSDKWTFKHYLLNKAIINETN